MQRQLAVLSLSLLLSACGSATPSGSGGASGGGGTATPTTEAAAIAVGNPAPDFMMQDQTGRVRTLSEYRGHPVVLYFYPRDATPGCTAEACAFRDAWTRLQATGAVVLGVSTDDTISHQRFHDEHSLPFDLLSDPDGTAAAAYNVPVRMGFASRQTFLIDAQGNIAHIWPDVDPGVHADEVLTAITALPAVE